MEKLVILTDSSSDLTDEQAKELNISVVRMPITVDGVGYIENDTINDQQLMEALNQGKVVNTSQPVLGEVIKKIEGLLKVYDKVLYIPLSSGLSGTYASGKALESNYDGRLVVIDSKGATGIIRYQLECAAKMIEQGKDSDYIKNALENHEYLGILIPDSLTCLMHGGRVSPAVAKLGNLLKIVPLLSVKDGIIDTLDKVRTRKKAYEKGMDYALDVKNRDDYEFFILYTYGNEQLANELSMQFKNKVGKEIRFGMMRAVICAHTGPAIAFGYLKKLV